MLPRVPSALRTGSELKGIVGCGRLLRTGHSCGTAESDFRIGEPRTKEVSVRDYYYEAAPVSSPVRLPVARGDVDLQVVLGPANRYELQLKIFLAIAFLPPELSLFIGDVRLPVVRIVLLVLLIPATGRFLSRMGSSTAILLPSDIIVMIAGAWMLAAGIATDGLVDGAKSAGAWALDFAGAYCVVRWLLQGRDSAVRFVRFLCWVMVVVTGLALLDPLTGTLFTHELAGQLTGRPVAFDPASTSFVRAGLVRAMGPIDHSILFGSLCAWVGIIAVTTFRVSRFTILFSLFQIVGCWYSESRAALAFYILGIGLVVYDAVMRQFAWRWTLMKSFFMLYLVTVFTFSRSPVSALLRSAGISPQAGWYRELIWGAVVPLVLGSPLFGLGLGDNDWDWRMFPGLVYGTVDALWLRDAMIFGIPGSILVFLTTISPYWTGSIDQSLHLSAEERGLGLSLGIVAFTTILLGFTVDYWGVCWIMLGVFPAIRAHLAEAAVLRARGDDTDPP